MASSSSAPDELTSQPQPRIADPPGDNSTATVIEADDWKTASSVLCKEALLLLYQLPKRQDCPFSCLWKEADYWNDQEIIDAALTQRIGGVQEEEDVFKKLDEAEGKLLDAWSFVVRKSEKMSDNAIHKVNILSARGEVATRKGDHFKAECCYKQALSTLLDNLEQQLLPLSGETLKGRNPPLNMVDIDDIPKPDDLASRNGAEMGDAGVEGGTHGMLKCKMMSGSFFNSNSASLQDMRRNSSGILGCKPVGSSFFNPHYYNPEDTWRTLKPKPERMGDSFFNPNRARSEELWNPYSANRRFEVERGRPFSRNSRFEVERRGPYSRNSRFEVERRGPYSRNSRFEVEKRGPYSRNSRFEVRRGPFSRNNRFEVERRGPYSRNSRFEVETWAIFSQQQIRSRETWAIFSQQQIRSREAWAIFSQQQIRSRET
ncbi:hypothetical protein Tsubulata_040804 [Turnera subulata]|uniref:Uncharacterized protein n=1 Tax=Turnera subulata TaxID=218843 RepID=A0A9Q0J2C8_9ROSI|nr:hypothetical protein Tsubulata_040804 [Turnera subulata]